MVGSLPGDLEPGQRGSTSAPSGIQLLICPSLTSTQWYVPICALFAGRLIDKPETPMPATPETSGGQVEHEVFLFNNLILFLVEMKHSLTATQGYHAQVLLGLLCETFRLLRHAPHLISSTKLQ
jgi:hypothetical protein